MSKQTITRHEAIEKGLERYYSGKPCPHGHYSERYVSSYGCIECSNGREPSPRRPQLIERDRMRVRQKHSIDIHTITRVSIGNCEVCGSDNGGVGLACDHDHGTNKFRGWLCRECNWLLGRFDKMGDPQARVSTLLAYKSREEANNVGVSLTSEQFEDLHYPGNEDTHLV